jgi:YVTN family beta-propeller protein
MISKPKLFSIALMSAAILLVLISIAGAYPFAYIANTGSNSVSVINTTNNNITAIVN